jgi:hypothetical protein
MTGKADAVRAVSQQFKDRTNVVIEGVMAHLRDDNARELLGPGLSPLIGRGSLKSIVTFALYADVLRMVRDMVMADEEISDEEVQESLGVLSVIAGGFAKVRSKDYFAFAQLSSRNARQFLAQYESDAGLFGHANEATKWAGVDVCRNIQSCCGDSEPLEAFGGSLVAWAEALAGSDGVELSEQAVLDAIRNYTVGHGLRTGETSMESGSTNDRVLTKEIAEQFCGSDSDFDLRKYKAITDEAAEVLGKYDGSGYAGLNIYLPRITHLSEAAAKALFCFEGNLELQKLESLSLTPSSLDDGTQWRADLTLGVTELSDETAAALASTKGSLSLDQLQTLPDSTAAILARHTGRLSLNGIDSLSDEAAKLLNRRNDLSCDNFFDLSSANTIALTFRGRGPHLYVDSVSDIEQLAEHADSLRETWTVDPTELGGEECLCESALNALAKLPCRIRICSCAIDETRASRLGAFKASALDLRECNVLSEEAARKLLEFDGAILVKMNTHDDAIRQVLKAHPSVAKWGECKGPYVDIVCKNCGDRQQLEFPDNEATIYSVFGDGPGPWALCPECRAELSEEELAALED